MSVGQRIRAYRKQRRLTQEKLGALCGVTAGAISSYENGVTVPKRRVADKLAQALGVPVDRLLEAPDVAERPPEPVRASDGLLYNGVLTLLKELYGPVEGRVIVGENGARRRYYVVRRLQGDFVLDERDVAAIVRCAKASLSPMVDYMRRVREAEYYDSGREYPGAAPAERLNAG